MYNYSADVALLSYRLIEVYYTLPTAKSFLGLVFAIISKTMWLFTSLIITIGFPSERGVVVLANIYSGWIVCRFMQICDNTILYYSKV